MELRSFFIQSAEGIKTATCTCWWNYTGERRDLALHWVGVRPEYQGLGLGKALVFEAVKKLLRMEGDRDIYLHTQTWSYKAVGIYLQAGFRLVKNETFGGGPENDYEKAVAVLQTKMKRERMLP